MVVSIITLFPDLYTPFLGTSLLKRAQEQGLISFSLLNLFDYTQQKERIDGPTYGHGAGMLLKPELVERAIDQAEKEHGAAYKIFFSPHGQLLEQDVLKTIMQEVRQSKKQLLLLPARYEGMDARVEAYYADKILSVGNFVLMGGDIPALMLLEGLTRLIPGVVGKQESVERDSFSGPFVDYPEYTAPVIWKDREVPQVVRSGNHKEIEQWRTRESVTRSVSSHFDWVRTHELTPQEKAEVELQLPAHYAVLMHSQVKVPGSDEGTTSVTSLDIHDIARSASTYGLKGYSIVTPLVDQQKIVQKLLDFWRSQEGADYNEQRQGALRIVSLVTTLQEASAAIKEREGEEPLLIGTSARMSEYKEHTSPITYFDQEQVWHARRPLLFVFGTGQGLSSSLLKQCDYLLPPLCGFSEFNHLSVRSAAALVFDRWLGVNVKKYYSLNHKKLSRGYHEG